MDKALGFLFFMLFFFVAFGAHFVLHVQASNEKPQQKDCKCSYWLDSFQTNPIVVNKKCNIHDNWVMVGESMIRPVRFINECNK